MAQIKALTPEGRLPTTAVTQVREMVPHPIQDIPTSTDWVRAEVDGEGRIAQAIDSQGRTWLIPHPDIDGLLDPAIAQQIREVDAPDWAWAVADESGRVAFGVRTDGTAYPSGGGAVAEPYDVILLVGQSNAQGAGRPVVDTEVWPNIDQYPAANKPEAGQIIPAVEPLQNPGPITAKIAHGPALFFARDYALRHPGRRVLIVPAAWSGTAFSSTGPDTWDWTSTEGGDNLAVRAVAQTQAALAAAGPGARLSAILWHQGEGDTPASVAGDYEATLEAFITWLRGQLDAPNVPFIVGQMGEERRDDSAGTITVDKAHIGMPARHLRAGFARATPAVHNPGDITHMSARGQMLMAESMWDAYGRALLNTDEGTAPLGVENLTARRVGDEVRVSWDPSWSRVLAYVIEWSTDGTTWSTVGVEQYAPLWCEATIAADPAVMHIRVTATNTYGSSAPYTIDA